MTHLRRQRGFTLIELMTASAAVGIIMLAGGAFMLRALAWYDEVSGKIEMNRHARLTYDLWAYGGMAATNGDDATKYLYGIRGRNAVPDEDDLRTSTGALQYISNDLTLTPDRFASMTVDCKAVDDPIPTCTGTSNRTVTGWLGEEVELDAEGGSLGQGWVTVRFTITNPYQAQRATGPAQFSDSYQTVFALNRQEVDP
jgi:prepilin-type N-terminal cleavage/methylation domain-containing protein